MISKARRTLASVAAIVMLAAPAAQAMPMDPQTGRPAHMQSIGMEYGDLRVDPTTSAQPTVAPAPLPASGGFDWIAAAIGAVVATGLALGSWTVLRSRRPVGRRAVV